MVRSTRKRTTDHANPRPVHRIEPRRRTSACRAWCRLPAAARATSVKKTAPAGTPQLWRGRGAIDKPDGTFQAAAMQTAGLVDLQVNGFAGVDFNDSAITPDALDHALHAMLRTGVTTCLPTLITATQDRLQERLQALDRAVMASRLGG